MADPPGEGQVALAGPGGNPPAGPPPPPPGQAVRAQPEQDQGRGKYFVNNEREK